VIRSHLHHGLIALLLLTVWSGDPQQQSEAKTAIVGTAETPVFPPLPKPEADYHPPIGQTLVYAAEWRVFNAGTATLRLDQEGDQGHISGTADAAGAVALLYHVSDRYNSVFDLSSFCSRGITKKMEEGSRRVNAKIDFDYERSKAVLDQKNLRKGDSKHVENEIPGCVTDVLSAFYYVGSLPLEPGKTVSFPLNDGGKTVIVDVQGEAREQIKTPAGTFNTIRVQPNVPSGVLKGKGKLWIWYSEDAPRVPVRLKGRLFWGTVTFTLQSIAKK
jgi:Protein of unknown function (DUF3108)